MCNVMWRGGRCTRVLLPSLQLLARPTYCAGGQGGSWLLHGVSGGVLRLRSAPLPPLFLFWLPRQQLQSSGLDKQRKLLKRRPNPLPSYEVATLSSSRRTSTMLLTPHTQNVSLFLLHPPDAWRLPLLTPLLSLLPFCSMRLCALYYRPVA